MESHKRAGVRVTNVSFSNMMGTSLTPVAITLNCSRFVGCTGILLRSIQITSAKHGQKVTSSCINANGFSIGMVQPEPCLQFR